MKRYNEVKKNIKIQLSMMLSNPPVLWSIAIVREPGRQGNDHYQNRKSPAQHKVLEAHVTAVKDSLGTAEVEGDPFYHHPGERCQEQEVEQDRYNLTRRLW